MTSTLPVSIPYVKLGTHPDAAPHPQPPRNKDWYKIGALLLVGTGLLYSFYLLSPAVPQLPWTAPGVSSPKDASGDPFAVTAKTSGEHLAAFSTKRPLKKNVAVASTFGFHFDVYMPVAWTLERVLPKDSTLRVYRPHGAGEEFGRGFDEIVRERGIYHGEYFNADNLVDDVRKGSIDLIILGTCELDMNFYSEQLLPFWDARGPDEKFDIVCIVHNVDDDSWHHHIIEWVERGSFRLLPIAEHVGRSFRHEFAKNADSRDPRWRHAGFEYVHIDTHYPVLALPPPTDKEKINRKVLSRAVIQGHIDTDRRDYEAFFDELVESMKQDPAAWGYLPIQPHTVTDGHYDDALFSFQPDPKSKAPPFTLHLAGSGWIEVPPEIRSLVHFHSEIDYDDFYKVIQSMDVVVPAFAEHGYFISQASSSAAMAVECNVPVLATSRFRHSYTYLDDDRVVITRPQVMREVEALKALRTGKWTPSQSSMQLPGLVPTRARRDEDEKEEEKGEEKDEEEHEEEHEEDGEEEDDGPFVAPDSWADANHEHALHRLMQDVARMLRFSWKRETRVYEGFKQELWKKNEQVMRRILAGQ